MMDGWESHHTAFQAAAGRRGGQIGLVVGMDMVNAAGGSRAWASQRASRIVNAGSCGHHTESWVDNRRSGGHMVARGCTCLRLGLCRPFASVEIPCL